MNINPPPLPVYTTTGGARVGFVNYTWPLAKLTVTADLLTLRTTMFGLFDTGTYSFQKSQIIALEPYGLIPLIGQGIRIIHQVDNYPKKIIFWCQPDSTLPAIARAGFVPDPNSPEILQNLPPTGFPIRWLSLIALLILWNALILVYVTSHPPNTPIPTSHVLVALWIVFTVLMSISLFRPLQKLLMKPGHSFGKIKPFVLLSGLSEGQVFWPFLSKICQSSSLSKASDFPLGSSLKSPAKMMGNFCTARPSRRALTCFTRMPSFCQSW